MNENIQDVTSLQHLGHRTSLDMMILSSIHFPANDLIAFSFTADTLVCVGVQRILFTRLSLLGMSADSRVRLL
jgi:hypothetical protein